MPSRIGKVTVDCGPDYESSVKVRTLLGGQGMTQAEERETRGSQESEKGKVLCKMKLIMF